MRGRFGLAVENIGDIDKDGYTDIAVSAPYAAGEGVVYIFRGAGDHLVTKDYQVGYHVTYHVTGLHMIRCAHARVPYLHFISGDTSSPQ